MSDFFSQLDATIYVTLAALVVLVAFGGYVIKRIRAEDDEGPAESHLMMTNFREMHAQGELSDEEYRTIKSTLAAKLRGELKDTDETG